MIDKEDRGRCYQLAKELNLAFCWVDSDDGQDYWEEIYSKLIHMSEGVKEEDIRRRREVGI
jgi:hypothetical protein